MDRTEQPSSSQRLVPFRLKTFGEARLLHPDGREAIQPSKPLALLTYLQCAPGRTATRDYLCALLWGDSAPRRALATLRTTLHRLQTHLGVHAAEGGGAHLTLHLPLISDRDEFLAALDQGDFAAATSLYQGPFFPEFGDPGTALFEQWADGERVRLRELFIRAAESLARQSLDTGRPGDAIRLARQVRTLAPESETGWRLLLEALLSAKDDLAARGEAEAFDRWLEQEGLEPEAASKRLIGQIRQGAAAAERHENGSLVAELIGRERTFAAVLQAWEAVRRGRSAYIHISAQAGIGKTRLLTDLAGRLTATVPRVVLVRANVGERTLDYAFASELARGLGALPGAVGVPPRSAGVLVGLQPALADVFATAQVAPTTDLLVQRALAIGELLAAVAEDGPVAVLVDDSHWLDNASRHILEFLAGRLDRSLVLLLTAGRPPETALAASAVTTTITLEPLALPEVEAFLGSLAELPEAPWVPALVAALHRATRGSPLLLVETLQLTRDRRSLTLNGVWDCLDPDALLAQLADADPLAERLLALDGESRRLVEYLAVSGAPLTVPDLAAAATRPTSSVTARLAALERRGLVLALGDRWAVGHDEIGAGLLALMSPADRRSAHRDLGRHWAAEATRAAEVIPRAVRHLVGAGADEEIVPLYRRWFAAARERGDTANADRLAAELLGEHATAERIGFLAGGLADRGRTRSRARPLAFAGLLLAAGAAIFTWSRGGAATIPPEEELMVAAGPDSAMSLYRIPIRAHAWLSHDSVRLSEGHIVGPWRDAHGAFGSPVMSPDGSRIVFSRIVADSGVIDLFLRESDGSVRRLTDAVGDDLEPSWSPDGRFLVFRTSRWSPPGDDNPDLAILEIATGRIRRLTSDPAVERNPQWSPDGSRIAFARLESNGRSAVCWITVDGATSACPMDATGQSFNLGGWLDADRLGLVVGPNDALRFSILQVSTATVTAVDTSLAAAAVVSPDGRWAIVAVGAAAVIFPIDDPRRRRPLPWNFYTRSAQPFWAPRKLSPAAPVRILGPGQAIVGVSHQLRLARPGSEEAVVQPPEQVLRWSSADSSILAVDPISGRANPRRPGVTWVRIDAGGWSRDSLRFEVRPAGAEQALRERWDDSWLSRWRPFGDPKPLIVPGQGGTAAFFGNGDRSFESGAVSVAGYRLDGGLGLETTFSAPISRPRWQQLRLGFVNVPNLTEVEPLGVGCRFDLPTGEGAASMGTMALSIPGESVNLPTRPADRDGSWHRVRMQIFPDGTCGIAVDGRPIWRSVVPMDGGRVYQVAVYGHSVDSRILVGPLEVWRGVRADVEWDRRPRDATRSGAPRPERPE